MNRTDADNLIPAPPPAAPADDDDARLLGAARLAFYTPVVDQPSVADRKATFLLTMTGLVTTTLFLFVPQLAAIISGPNRAVGLAAAALTSALVGLLIGAAKFAYGAYVSPMPAHPAPTFYRHVAGRPFDQYAAELRGADLRQAVEAILRYNHAAATQAAAKYRGVNRAQRYMRLAIPAWMA
ncbi:MAG TPA: hypothetical protein VF796_14260, partial [Humisphaera sp.]